MDTYYNYKQVDPGVFDTRSANSWLAEGDRIANPQELFYTFWHEGEACCLFADTNTGKSLLAVQIGNEIATVLEKKVLYFDFEMSTKQFQMRYSDKEAGTHTDFSPLFMRVECVLGKMPEYVDGVFEAIKQVVRKEQAEVVIIDNLTWLCGAVENGEAAAEFMRLLLEMKQELNLSVLVLSHTPKRNPYTPLDQNSLAGSKRLANFFDAIFALGVDHNDEARGRYLKQIKVRSDELRYHSGNVLPMKIVRGEGGVHFEECGGPCTERDMLGDDPASAATAEQVLKRREAQELRELRSELILDLHCQGLSQRAIAEKLNVAPSTVNLTLARLRSRS